MEQRSFSVEAFLDEREVRLDREDGAVGDFYDDLKKVLGGAETYIHGHMGDRKKKDDDFNSLVPLSQDRVLFFRGQCNSTWGLSSSLYRLIQTKLRPRVTIQEIERIASAVEKRMIDVARKNGLIHNLSDLELMTVLQHHGAPTRLLDVTTDWKVALYFACESLEMIDGRLFLISITPSSWGEFPRMKEGADGLVWWEKGELEDRLSQWNERVWPVLLPFVDARMIAQQGYYLVGGMNVNRGKQQYYSTVGGVKRLINNADMRKVCSLSIAFPKGRGGPNSRTLSKRLELLLDEGDGTWYSSCISLKIPAHFKPGLLQLLRQEGIHSDSIFPPVSETERLLSYIAKEEAGFQMKSG